MFPPIFVLRYLRLIWPPKMVVMLRQCCCGCSLKTGAIILGVLNIIGGVWNLISGIMAASVSDYFDEDTKKVLVPVGAVLAVFGAILVLVSICLIIGAQKGNPVLLVPWMVFVIVFLVANTVLYIVYAVQYFAINDTTNGAGNIIAAIIYLLLQTYFLLVVYSLYRELKGTAPPNSAWRVRLNNISYEWKSYNCCLSLQLGWFLLIYILRTKALTQTQRRGIRNRLNHY